MGKKHFRNKFNKKDSSCSSSEDEEDDNIIVVEYDNNDDYHLMNKDNRTNSSIISPPSIKSIQKHVSLKPLEITTASIIVLPQEEVSPFLSILAYILNFNLSLPCSFEILRIPSIIHITMEKPSNINLLPYLSLHPISMAEMLELFSILHQKLSMNSHWSRDRHYGSSTVNAR